MATTGGTGGPLTNDVSGWWAATNGYSSKYRWWAAHIDTAKPIGIFVWFHGDGAYEYNNPTDTAYIGGPGGILQACIEQNMILVVPLTPDDDGTLTWWEWGSKTGTTQWAKEMIHANFYDRYNIDRGKIWFGGFSGGAEFLTAQFLPHWGNDLLIEAGGAVITGGGTFHSDYGGDSTFDPAYKANFRMYWRTGEDDTAANSEEGFDGVAAAQTGEAWYRNKGFPTNIYLVPGKSHLLNGLYGGYIREALADTGGPAQSGVYIGSQLVIGMYVGSTPVTAVYVGSQKVWPTGPVTVQHEVSVSGTGTRPLVTVSVPAGETWTVTIQGTVTRASAAGSSQPTFRIGSSVSGRYGQGATVSFAGTVTSSASTIAMEAAAFASAAFVGTVTIEK